MKRWVQGGGRRCGQAYTLVEIMVATAIIGISFVSFYAGITAGVQVIQLARENLRATQILVERMETLRIKTWEQVTNGVDVPTTFTEDFYPKRASNRGITYYGSLSVSNVDLRTNYDDELRLVTISLTWTNGGVPRVRTMRSYVARNGMQNYVF
ncbi:prepilin-type N-terminal cleavage/methylation domain-containing protein [Fontisphaera persica]|uniref:type IV pilus modification PilV family protein n=1 Tax=Fontisphaera persica TaxID=2974023 RepID=UPI0024C0ADE7|nr:prepilin-type N-terminal cleavage/methylation domain-containing protein [Fontisphaera persica]WCJ59161.1 prepilin-type N-terminal cleavage/methylation domain-containing protein [Fontisphaera persica]